MMKSYNKQNLQQCVRNLFAQARYEFRAIHDIESKFKIAAVEGMIKSKVFSLWDNEDDCFYATALELIRVNSDSKIMIDLSVYVKYSDYTCSSAMGLCETPEEVYEWLKNPDSLKKCLMKVEGLIDNIDEPAYGYYQIKNVFVHLKTIFTKIAEQVKKSMRL